MTRTCRPRFVAQLSLQTIKRLCSPRCCLTTAASARSSLAREFAGAFSASEIALLKTFADQAVIAIENARLFNETKEALEQQTATAEVLSVISSSIADSVPVFEKILERCAHLFSSSEQGVLLLGDDRMVHLAAHRGSARERLAPFFPSPQPENLEASIFSGRVLHYRDILADADVPPGIRAIAEQIGIGSYSQMFAPMVWEGRAIGTLYVTRQPPTGFSEKEVGLLRTFADQAVIAIQNSRLFNETREALRKVELRTAELTEALDYQTAISDVLRVISQSPTDVNPVFEEILKSASRLFGSPVSAVFRYDGRLVHLAATRNWPAAAIADASRFYPAPPNPAMLSGRVILSGSVQSEEDALTDPQYDRQAAGLGHWRRMIGAPLLRDGQPIGAIIVAWPDPGKTPTRQADLLKTFADQAVIAIENVRLISETTEALEQQTATAEVLQVISGSVADTAAGVRQDPRQLRAAVRGERHGHLPDRRCRHAQLRRIPGHGRLGEGGQRELPAPAGRDRHEHGSARATRTPFP